MTARRTQRGDALGKLLLAIIALAIGVGILAWKAPEYLPKAVRDFFHPRPADKRDDPESADYAPEMYRYRDKDGVLHVSDRPPFDHEYRTQRIRNDANVAPMTPDTDDVGANNAVDNGDSTERPPPPPPDH